MLHIVTIILIALLAGCSTTASVGFRDMSHAYREVVESYSNDNILINIVRASQNMPLSFMDIPTVIGNGMVAGNIGVGASFYSANPTGPLQGVFSTGAGSSYSPSASITVSRGFNFTQSSLDNSKFETAFLSDIKPETIASLTNNTTGPLSLLYSLAIEYIEIHDPNGGVVRYFNDPFRDNYSEFQAQLYKLIDQGLTTELIISPMPLSPKIPANAYIKNLAAIGPVMSQPDVIIENGFVGGSKQREYFQVLKKVVQTKMCISPKDSIGSIQEYSESAYCAKVIDPSRASSPLVMHKVATQPKKALVIKLRSTRSVFAFLGQILNLQMMENPRTIFVKNSDLFKTHPELVEGKATSIQQFPIIVFERNAFDLNTLSKVSYRGDTYSVPEAAYGGSRQVLVLLSEMLTLNKVPGSVPPSPALLIQ